MIKIAEIEENSLAMEAGLMAGDKILKINGEEVRDRLDFEFYKSEENLELEVMRGQELLQMELDRDYGSTLGIIPEVMKIHLCKNNCVFCFVYQNPRGMRKSLYVKDEDYRYSFLDGHFTTLSNMGPKEWTRVVEQHLSPIYISVHATDPELRAKLLGNQKLEPILERLHWLREKQIDFHTQLVVIPGWNDKAQLKKSIEELMEFYPSLLSISVVPVGLTGHRRHLVDLNTFSESDAKEALDIVHSYNRICEEKFGCNFVYASDEMYVKANEPLPSPEYYGDFSQYENGVGTLCYLLKDYQSQAKKLPAAPKDWNVSVATAQLASGTLEKILTSLKEKNGLNSELKVCENKTFGKEVSVTGLLCGRDFIEALKDSHLTGPVLIPPNSLNGEGKFLDDLSCQDLEKALGRTVIAPESFMDFFPRKN